MGKARRWLLLTVLTILILSVAACQNKENISTENNIRETPTKTEPINAPAEEQSLHLMLKKQPSQLDSAIATDRYSFEVLNATMSGLMRLDAQHQPQPELAADFPQISEDGLTYTFTIRKDAKWSDESPVTAYDFEYAWKRVLNPMPPASDIPAPYAYLFYVIDGAKPYNEGVGSLERVGVRALDGQTLEVRLERPSPFFLSMTAFATFFPQKQEFVESQGSAYGDDPSHLLYNGPFRLSEWQKDSLTLSKNPAYWDAEKVKLDKVHFAFLPNTNEAVNLYEAGDLDVVSDLTGSYFQLYKEDPGLYRVDKLFVYYLTFNLRSEPFNNAAFRQAFHLAIDRQEYTASVLNNGSLPATGLVPPSTLGLREGFRKENGVLIPVSGDAEGARAALERGIQELGYSSVEALPPVQFLADEDDLSQKSAQFLKERLEKVLGVKVNVESVSFQERLSRFQSHDFEFSLAGWGADYNDAMTFLDIWTSDAAFNSAGWTNGEYNRLITSAQQELDAHKRMQLLYEAERLLMQSAPIAPIYFQNSYGLNRSYVKGLTHHPFGAEFELKGAYIDGKETAKNDQSAYKR